MDIKQMLKKYWMVLVAVGIFFFIPDPFDFVLGIGTIVEGISLVLGVIGAFTK